MRRRLVTWISRCAAVGLCALGACTPAGDAPAGGTGAATTTAASGTAPGTSGAATAGTAAPPGGGAGAPLRALPAGAPLAIGVTLHPYYSWTKNVVGDAPGVEIRSVLPGDVDAGNYQPRPEDIQKLAGLQAIVTNGLGHDDFINDMIKASGNAGLVVLRPNEGTPTIRGQNGGSINSHTFISFTNAIQQTYAIEKALSALRPDAAEKFRTNAGEYAKRLRLIKAGAAQKLAAAKITRVVTVHDGYSYLCQELGIDVAGVVEPAHGLVPSANELAAMVELLKKEKIRVVLTEETFPDKLLEVLRSAGEVKVYVITHIASGEYTADKFEKEMQKNVDTLVQALVTDG
ncbi:MAG: zinc ABC transporter substrate-binding protein [Polyangiaceae bacterium]